MKKLSLIASLGCLLTVSSVYATWIYAEASAGSVSESIIPQMAGVGEASKKGTITVVTSGLTMVIDNAGETDPSKNYVPVLKVSGSISVSFTPNVGASQSVIDNGIKMSYTLSVTSGWQYDSDGDGVEDKDIFVLDTENCTNVLLEDGDATAEVKESTISSETIASYITLNIAEGFKLDTKAKFEAFKSSLNKANSLFTLTVNEVA